MEILKNLRTQHGYNQQKLSELLNVSRSTVAMWETDKAEPNSDLLIKLSDIFKVSIDYLLGRTNTPQHSSEVRLQPAEENLLHKYRLLDDSGKSKVEEYLDDLAKIYKITKIDNDNTVVTLPNTEIDKSDIEQIEDIIESEENK